MSLMKPNLLIGLILFVTIQSFAQTKWYKYPGNPVFYGGGTEDWDYQLGRKAMIYDQGMFHMWYTGKDINGRWQMGYATSPDGIDWDKYPSNPINFEFDCKDRTLQYPGFMLLELSISGARPTSIGCA